MSKPICMLKRSREIAKSNEVFRLKHYEHMQSLIKFYGDKAMLNKYKGAG